MDTTRELHRNSVEYMRDAVFFDGIIRSQRQSRFWVLLILSSVIAAAGVVADSTATVIGAMIVAPMMLPIQGTMLATVLADRANLIRSIILVILGAATAVGIGFIVGALVANDVVAATNSQVDGRVSPGLIDLLAALGTGVVGSIALVRPDISDTLPGVAIAISLVPPLAVAGLTLESGAPEESLGALLLFVTNVTAILATGIVVMAIYGVHRAPRISHVDGTVNRLKAILVIAVMGIIIGIPLTISSVTSAADTVKEGAIQATCEQWAEAQGWDLVAIQTSLGNVTVRLTGPLPVPSADDLADALSLAGVDPSSIHVEMLPSYSVTLE